MYTCFSKTLSALLEIRLKLIPANAHALCVSFTVDRRRQSQALPSRALKNPPFSSDVLEVQSRRAWLIKETKGFGTTQQGKNIMAFVTTCSQLEYPEKNLSQQSNCQKNHSESHSTLACTLYTLYLITDFPEL